MKKFKLIRILFYLLMCISLSSLGQNVDEYRTRASGNWANPNIWQRFNGTVWENASNSPSSSTADRTAVRNIHSVTITSAVSIDQFRIAGNLVVEAGGIFTIENGDDTDLTMVLNGNITVDGILEMVNSTNSSVTAANMSFSSGSRYRHLFTSISGQPLTATWDINSTMEVAGYSSTVVISGTRWQQTFGHVEINLASLGSSGTVFFNGNINNIGGDLAVISTGSGQVRLNDTQTSTINVTGNLTVLNNSNVNFNRTGSVTYNIGGNLDLNTANNTLMSSSGQTIMNITGDFNMNNSVGTIVNCGVTGTAQSIFNIMGDANFNSGSLTENGVGSQGYLNFVNNSVVQFLTRPGNQAIISGQIHYNVAADAILDLANNAIIGDGDLIVSGTLRVGGQSSSGAIQANPASSGNVRNTGSRTFNPGSTIVYNGAGLQYIGTGHPGVLFPDVDVILDNGNGLSISTSSNNFHITGQLILTDGDVNVEDNQTLTFSDIVPNSSVINLTSLANLTLNGSGDFGTLPLVVGDLSMGALTLNRTSGSLTMDRNLTLNGGLTLTDGDLVFSDFDLTLNGTYSRVSGRLECNENSSITIGGSGTLDYFSFDPTGNDLNSLTITRSTESTGLVSTLNLHNLLSVENGSSFDSDGFLVLLSQDDEPIQDANIAELNNGSSIIGAVTVHRFMSTEGALNRYISSPVQDATVQMLQDNFSITGNFTGTSYPCTGCANNSKSLRYYDETVAGNISKGYVGYPNSINSEPLEVGRGYLAYIWDGSTQITWDVTGPINSGAIDFNISNTTSAPADPDADGWNLVGNPYPSSITWDNGAGWTKTDVAPIIYVPDVAAGVYRIWDASDASGDLPNGTIAMGQAFWVYAETQTASLEINEGAKTTNSGTFFRTATADTNEILKLSISNGKVRDNAFIKINEYATNGYDRGYDGLKLEGELMSISLVNGKSKFVKYVTDDLQSVTINVKSSNYGKFFLEIDKSAFVETQNLNIYDNYTGANYNLNSIDKIEFQITSDPHSQGDRFTLQLEKVNVDQPIENNFDSYISIYPNPVDEKLFINVFNDKFINAKLINNKGQLVEASLKTDVDAANIFQGYVDLSQLKAGIYLLLVELENKTETRRILKR